jgi:chromosome partitioning protein
MIPSIRFPLIYTTVSGNDVLPATIDLAAAEIELVNMTLRELVLRDVIEKLRPKYNHILIDCPPSLGLLTVNALAASDQVIIPLLLSVQKCLLTCLLRCSRVFSVCG